LAGGRLVVKVGSRWSARLLAGLYDFENFENLKNFENIPL